MALPGARTDDGDVNTLIVVIAQYLLYAMVVIAGLVWLTVTSREKAVLTAEAVLGLVMVGIGIWVAGHLHTDPRPFVHDPASKPLFAHPADNGFPSDHSAAAGLLAALVFRYRRILGGLVAAAAVLIAWARVAAHVHHGQDVIAGLVIGVAAGVLAIWLAGLLADALRRRGFTVGGSQARTTADRSRSSD
jgi:membrane-associated phospholipid phosphatase